MSDVEKYPKVFDGKTKHDCECYNCGYVGKIDTYAQAGGMIYENPDRYHITGDCPTCELNLINVHVTRKSNE